MRRWIVVLAVFVCLSAAAEGLSPEDAVRQGFERNGGLWFPRGYAWQRGMDQKTADYRESLRRALAADPSNAPYICATFDFGAEHPVNYATPETMKQLRAAGHEVCADVPISAAQRETVHRIVFNLQHPLQTPSPQHATTPMSAATLAQWAESNYVSARDEAAKLSADARAAEAQNLRQQLKSSGRSDQAVQSLRYAMLVPHDWHAAFLLRTGTAPLFLGDQQATEEQVAAAIETTLERHATADPGREAKRIWNGYLAAKGDLPRALEVAKTLSGKTLPPDAFVGYDVIHGAVLRDLVDGRNEMTSLLANCPAPDTAWILRNGSQTSSARFCETQISTLAADLQTAMGKSAPKRLTEMLVLYSHSAPAAGTGREVDFSMSFAARQAQELGMRANRLLDEASGMTKVQREQEAYRLRTQEEIRTFEAALRLLMLRPEHDAGVFEVLQQIALSGSSTDEKGATFDFAVFNADAVRNFIEAHAAGNGAEAEPWKRAQRNWLLYTGEYQQALAMSRRLIGTPPRSVDVAALAALEWVTGNRKGYDAAIAKCPGRTEESVRNDEPELQDPKDFCRSTAWWIARRTVELKREKTPQGFKEMMLDMAEHPVLEVMGMDSLQMLKIADPAMAEKGWDEMLHGTDLSRQQRLTGMRELISISLKLKQGEKGMRRVDEYFTELGVLTVGFPEDGWKGIANGPTNARCYGCSFTVQLMRDRLQLALMVHDEARARESIEWMVEAALENGDAASVRQALLQLAEHYVDAGMKSEASRVLGYLGTTSLDISQTGRLNALRQRFGSEPSAQASPWDTKPSPPRMRNQPDPTPDTTRKS